MHTETVSTQDLLYDPNNARRHSKANLDAIKASLRKFGQVLPLVVRDGVVIGGNGTLDAMRQLGWDKAEVYLFDGTPEQAKALGIALNRTAELAAWDTETLGSALVELADAGYVPDDLGFAAEDLELIFPEDKIRHVEFDASGSDAGEETGPKCSAIVFAYTSEEIERLVVELEGRGFRCELRAKGRK